MMNVGAESLNELFSEVFQGLLIQHVEQYGIWVKLQLWKQVSGG